MRRLATTTVAVHDDHDDDVSDLVDDVDLHDNSDDVVDAPRFSDDGDIATEEEVPVTTLEALQQLEDNSLELDMDVDPDRVAAAMLAAGALRVQRPTAQAVAVDLPRRVTPDPANRGPGRR